MLNRKRTKTPPARTTSRNASNPSTFSYYSSRSRPADPIERGKKKPATPKVKLSIIIRHLPSILSAIAIIFSLAYMSTLSPTPKIVPISDSTPNLLRSTQHYQDEAAKILARSVFNKSKLTISSKSAENAMLKRFPELDNVSLIVPFASRRPIMELQPAIPALILASEKGAYVIDTNGKAVIEADKTTNVIRSNIPLVSDESGLSAGIGKLMLTKETVSFVSHVTMQLTAKGLEIGSITLPAIPQEMHIRLKGESYYIKFNLEGNPRLQSGALIAVTDKLKSEGKKPNEYIDVRIEDKIFYK